MKKILLPAILIVSIISVATTTVLAAKEVGGGIWSYGGHHDFYNWGAFSNYWHPSKKHNSTVVRASDAQCDKKYAGAGGTSKAFINTKIGEVAYFYYGF